MKSFVGNSTVGAGLVMQMVYNVINFELRHVKHRNLAEVTKVLLRSEGKILCK